MHTGIYTQALAGQCSIAEIGDRKLCVLIAFRESVHSIDELS